MASNRRTLFGTPGSLDDTDQPFIALAAAAPAAAPAALAAAPAAVPLATGLPVIGVTASDVVEDGAATDVMSFRLTLSAASAISVSAHFTISGGSSRAGADYDPLSGYVTFQPGQTVQTVTLNTHPGAVGANYFWFGLDSPSGATLAQTQVTGTITNISRIVSAVPVTVHQAAYQPPSTLIAPGFLSTRGNQILDANGRAIKLNTVNWSGLETGHYAPDGLWAQSYKTLMDQMVQLGFNSIRLPFSDQLGDAGANPDDINYRLNPDLAGLSGLQVMDKVVAYAGQVGLKIILDHHRSSAGYDPNDNGLWYENPYNAAKFQYDWTWLAQHYAGNSTVIGGDLANEPHGAATWGDGGPNDWQAAAQATGNAIQAVNPNWLVIVDGIESYANQWTWWGGNLMGVAQHPVTLNIPNHVVYTAHDYPASVTDIQPFLDASYPNNMPAYWNKLWGYVYTQNIAPVLIGEFGSTLKTTIDQQWLVAFENYVNGNAAAQGGPSIAPGNQGISTGYWSFNGDALRTTGVLQTDWTTVNTGLLEALQPSLGHPAATGAIAPSGLVAPGQDVPFQVTLAQPSAGLVTVHYQTIDGTAHAGTDYVALSGDFTFAAGQVQQLVTAHLLDPSGRTGSLQFSLGVSVTAGAAQAGAPITATIVHDAAVPASTTTPVAGGVSLRVTAVNGGVVQETATVTNNAATPLTDWAVRIQTADVIGNLSGGVVTNPYLSGAVDIGGTAATNTIAAYGSQSFSFQASGAAGASISAQLVKFGDT